MKNIKFIAVLWLFSLFLLPPSLTYAAEEGDWVLSENGKNWMYIDPYEEPIKDAWIEEDGREYYLDSRGYMKKGWVTDKDSGERYYMGEDGAKSFDTFTPDGRYVGGEGIVLESFDTYRKAIKQPLNKLMKAKEYKGLAVEQLPVFSLVDMNGDDYRDLVVYDSVQEPRKLLLAALWDCEEKELRITAESDPLFEGTSGLTRQPGSETVWLTMNYGNGWDRDYFSVDSNSFQFEHIWKFTVETNDWGDREYYWDGERLSEELWNQAIIDSDKEAGEPLQCEYLPLTEESIKAAVDKAPSEEEMPLWQ